MNLQKLWNEDQLKLFKILCVVLIVCLIVVSLGLGLGLGLKHQSAPTEEKGEPSWLEDQCEEIKTPECPTGFSRPPLILISLDGFRAGYLKSWDNFLPVIGKLRTCGTHSKYMRAMYPTKTFPNHYTIVTGLYAETHGIVDNNMYDYVFKKSFSLSGDEKNNPKWWGGQPIWLTAMYQNLKAGTFFWPGSDVKINGTYPNKYQKFNSSIPFEERVRTILKWLSLPESERPEFYTLYFDEPDHAGHKSGPDSGAVVEALQLVDRIVGMLMDGLKKRNLHKCVNLIIVADHGMENTYCDQTEYMTNYFDSVKNLYVYNGPAARIRAKNVPADYLKFDAEGTVKNLSCRYSKQHFIPYMAYELPKRFHYANNRRINKEVHLYLDKQWQAARDKSYNFCGGGNHGYDNEYKSMHAIFIGNGPGFKFKTEVGPFDNIELYNLMCDMLQITPSPNNGTHGSLNHLLKNPPKSPTLPAEVSALSSCPFLTLNLSDHLGCSCENSTLNIKEMNKNINLTAEQVKTAEAVSMPYGRPRVLQRNSKYCLLTHNSYTNGYSSDILMPLWSAYNVNKSQGPSVLPPVIPNCLRGDPRISAITSQRCSYYNTASSIGYEFLYPPNMVTGNQQYDALITSNLVPMYQAFKQIWQYLHDTMLLKEAAARNGVNVMSGPVFDYNYDGHFDTPKEIKMHVNGTNVPIPTHFYVILTNCNNTAQTPLSCVGPLSVRSFILPHRRDNSESCPEGKRYPQWIEERIWAHTARVRDVELITGLDFYQDRKQPVIEILQLKTYLPEFIPHV
ncbi:ectonucleotide pyrophosphatase/phosphodiesterase family member 3-like isoform X1 [Hypanus sabinus]|uniref:ectonucleotide pyrophosphatase/phosphodiesterase family member 3-like isoform X1 n=1 Tax=Hypanus sabinus TaxID=79690 RepID=UPI0028C49312|nr:ectonucleotide pyrophosphatase/phosphodiesterase family member 3-like isoform X1 [Hypanus sabinus]XP_059837553.1 ectonucleotide pyrophosphatase/phosphodiesterase family member 3-like isoform X1 [Hypanus sabinus]XP_059837555.1 ectonucleotide pyrophosphatase/phosphodiesterase family member 3-like isoform X1 [Hypanus sabinus]XP_059837556.1 ectonucleotide pyrophosphatase/phosphodiesterase family member 3-like isoform X1 [Hypanus sabinus]